MNQIRCPKCGEVFTIDESSYDSIVKQIRDHQFDEELKKREKEYSEKLETELKLVKAKAESDNNKILSEKDREIDQLKAMLEGKDKENELVTREAVDELQAKLVEKENLILRLDAEIKNKETENQLNLSKALEKKSEEILELKANAEAMKESYRKELSDKDELIAYYKDFKAKQSTKMIGEDLEQHCLYEFNRVRPLFRNAYFEKDNDASQGSKGDFIFRDKDDEGTEIVSIMFEMKNEADTTATKHKNEDFLAKLDKDRKEKNCEYAILVSLLESDSELYNAGIVDVSYRYDKMYVVRPQCFIPIITLLRNAAKNALKYKQELAIVKNQDIDISNFEENLLKFKDDFGRNYNLAHSHFEKAIDEIDKTIQHLEKVKKELQGSDNQLRIATNKVEDVDVKKLTKGNPTMQARFEEIRKNKEL